MREDELLYWRIAKLFISILSDFDVENLQRVLVLRAALIKSGIVITLSTAEGFPRYGQGFLRDFILVSSIARRCLGALTAFRRIAYST